MLPGFLVKLRPSTPWRIAPDSGARDSVDCVYHSDSLFSAVTQSMERLGMMEEWLQATTSAERPAVAFSSGYPFSDDNLLIIPPRSLWPPPPSSRARWKAARFVPLKVVESLLKPDGKIREDDGWIVDAESECLLPLAKNGKALAPFRIAMRKSVAIDRITGVAAEPVITACLEFAPNSGMWFAAAFADESARERWSGPVTAAIRLLCDSGFGGERSRGWGRAAAPEITNGEFPRLLLANPAVHAPPANGDAEQHPQDVPPPVETAYWLLSLFSPRESDAVDWERGAYSLVTRNGRIESKHGHGTLKNSVRMVSEGSVVLAATPPTGTAPDVAPPGFPHPSFRSGFAVSIPIAWRVPA
jgi:CRISPR type III-A-associated RAMP protein Csm4